MLAISLESPKKVDSGFILSNNIKIKNYKLSDMNEDVELILEEAKDRMFKALEHLEFELSRLRAGRANPVLLDGITVDYYGVKSPLSQVSNINTPDAKTILIQPWERNMLGPIEKSHYGGKYWDHPSQ